MATTISVIIGFCQKSGGGRRGHEPPRSKGKGKALVQEMDQGEVTGVSCDLCEKKGIPCWWGKVSLPYSFP